MNNDVAAPREVCEELLPLKAIQTRRRGKHRQSCSLHPEQTKSDQPKEKCRGKTSHSTQTEQGSTCQSRGTRVSRSHPLSSTSDGQAEVTRSRNRLNYELGEPFQSTKPSVLEKFQAAFTHQKAKKEAIRCNIHGDEGPTKQKPNSPTPQVPSQPRQKKTLSPGAIDFTCHLHPNEGNSHKEPTCTRIVCHLHPHEGNSHNESICARVIGRLPQEDAWNFSSNPSVSTSHKVHVATQCCIHKLAASNQRRGHLQEESTAAISSQSGSASTKTDCKVHGALDHEVCRSRADSPGEPSSDVVRLYEECHLHHIEEHITASQRSSSRDSRRLQRCGDFPEQRCVHTPPQIIFTCHQRIRHQSVVEHHEVCHLHGDDDHEPLAQLSPISRDSTKLCERCGLPEPRRSEFSSQGAQDHPKAYHQSSKGYVNIKKLCAQMIAPRSGALSPCSLHGDCGSEKVETCGVCWHPKTDHIRMEGKSAEVQKHSRRGKIQGCHLHREPPPNPKRQEPKDPQAWTPRPAPKLRPCTSVRWLDRIIASQTIPPQIIREFLQGRRGWPPGAMKQKCLGCTKKPIDENETPRGSYPREFDVTSWNPGSNVARSAIERAKEHHDEKLVRLLVARTTIIKPIVKLSTSKETWRSREELQFCSECWNPTKFGRWALILEEMSKEVSEVADLSRCDTKFSSCTAHGNPNPCDSGDVKLHRPELFSTFQLRLKAQKLQNEIFDRNTALQACGSLP